MSTFVLVHGAYCGGWSWKKVTPPLRAAGHDVYTPTLTGLGERAHLLTPDVNLSTYIHDIVNLLFYEDLHDVILVGWGYSGMVITGVAEQAAERLGRLIYLDAPIPEDGQSTFDVITGVRDRWIADSVAINGAQAKRRLSRQDIIDAWMITDPDDVAWMDARLTPMPLATFEEPIRLPEYRAQHVPRSYIACAGSDFLAPMARKARAQGWDYHEVPRGHVEVGAAPDELVSVLLQIARDTNT